MTLIPFEYNDQPVRVIEIDGEPWFVLADLCKVLGMTRSAAQVSERLEDGVRQTYPITDSLGRTQQATIVSEAGMYEVVIRSDKPEAAAFRRWITHEVLPAIRKHGSYGIQRQLTPDEIVAQALQITNERVKALAATVEDQRRHLAIVQPKADAFDRWLSSNINYAVDTVAKALRTSGVRIGRNRLHDLMRTPRREGGLGWTYRVSRGIAPMQEQVECGRLAVKFGRFDNSKTGEEEASSTVRITPKGAAWLATYFGVLPEDVAYNLEGGADDVAA